MAAALLALNQVFGDCYEVDAAEVEDQQGLRGKVAQGPVHLRRPDPPRRRQPASGTTNTPDGRKAQSFFRRSGPEGKTLEDRLELLNRAHYVKEVFGDSDTVMAIISGVPSRDWDKNPLPPDQMVATRKFVNDLAGSQRVLSHGLLRPNLGKPEMEEMERQVKELKIDAWKMYTGAEIGEKAWFMDDEKVAYPFWEKTKKLGIKNLCVHKGLPLGFFNEKACPPLDLEKAAKDWPDLNFIVYHSGFRGFGLLANGTGEKVVDPKTNDPQEIPWISDIFRILQAQPTDQEHLFRAGQHLQHDVAVRAGHVHAHARPDDPGRRGRPHPVGHRFDLGRQPAEPDRALAALEDEADELIEKYKYPELTDEIKNQIFGLNAAKLFGVDPKESRQAIKADKLTQLREEYQRDPAPSNTQYGWVWVEDDQEPTVPVGDVSGNDKLFCLAAVRRTARFCEPPLNFEGHYGTQPAAPTSYVDRHQHQHPPGRVCPRCPARFNGQSQAPVVLLLLR